MVQWIFNIKGTNQGEASPRQISKWNLGKWGPYSIKSPSVNQDLDGRKMGRWTDEQSNLCVLCKN